MRQYVTKGWVWLAMASMLLLATAVWAQSDDHYGHDMGAGAASTAAGDTLEKLIGQIRVGITHASFSLDSDQLGSRQTHAHHVVNILEGVNGPHFDASKGNPGDGYGALNYASEAARTDATERWAENTLRYLTWAAEEALAATRTANYDEAGTAIHRSLAYLSAALGRADDTGALGSALAWQAAAPKEVTIEISGFTYGDGEDLVIPVGTTVVWVNRDAAPHTVTGSSLASPTLSQGDTFTYTFTEAGVYDYVCAFHPAMTHRIIVQ